MNNLESLYLNEIPEDQVNKFKNSIDSMTLKVEELNDKIKIFTESLNTLEIDKGLSYLDAKNVLLSLYMSELNNFIIDKSKGNINQDLIKTLLNLKVTQEKLKVIDTKLKPQIDKFQKIAEGNYNDDNFNKPNILDELEENSNNLEKPNNSLNEKKEKSIKFINPNKHKELKHKKDELVEDDNNKINNEDINNKTQNSSINDNNKFKINKLNMHFNETNNEKVKRRKDIEKNKEKLKNSELYNELINEISERPEEIGDDYSKSNLGKYLKEVDNYERDMMTRVFVGKKKIKQLNKKDKKIEDLGNFNSELKHLDSIFKYDKELKNMNNNREEAKSKFEKKFKRENNFKKNSSKSNKGKSIKFLNKKRI